ncbi:hypothetical protein IV203_015463 [Nitzschia inconspicua]|uniref:Uncharacterized protein n=1 Tax=Nitzschia inconspicua TaxID=303405 RepID=A0A9K3PVN9_9STRA|nr:hypothetical protein IV203_020302 [Nitzschia inconspicua]KAG7358874.1 hypothetical protein IV203_015463 [Nitzschia inconspicua]
MKHTLTVKNLRCPPKLYQESSKGISPLSGGTLVMHDSKKKTALPLGRYFDKNKTANMILSKTFAVAHHQFSLSVVQRRAKNKHSSSSEVIRFAIAISTLLCFTMNGKKRHLPSSSPLEMKREKHGGTTAVGVDNPENEDDDYEMEYLEETLVDILTQRGPDKTC